MLLFTTALTAETKEYKKLYGLYNKGKSTKLLSKANKVKEKGSREAMPYYFIALGFTERGSGSIFPKIGPKPLCEAGGFIS